MRVQVQFRIVQEGSVEIEVDKNTSICDYASIAENEYSDGDLYCSDDFQMTNYDIIEDDDDDDEEE